MFHAIDVTPSDAANPLNAGGFAQAMWGIEDGSVTIAFEDVVIKDWDSVDNTWDFNDLFVRIDSIVGQSSTADV